MAETAEIKTRPSALGAAFVPGRFGAPAEGVAPVALAERRERAVVQVMPAPRGQRRLAGAVKDAFGLALPKGPGSSEREATAALWIAPHRWLLVADDPAFPARVAHALGDGARHLDLTHARTVVTIAGAAARDVLNAGCPLDLHPDAFRDGATATSHFGPVTVTLHRRGERFDLYVLSSYARHFWEMLTDAALPYGGEVEAGASET